MSYLVFVNDDLTPFCQTADFIWLHKGTRDRFRAAIRHLPFARPELRHEWLCEFIRGSPSTSLKLTNCLSLNISDCSGRGAGSKTLRLLRRELSRFELYGFDWLGSDARHQTASPSLRHPYNVSWASCPGLIGHDQASFRSGAAPCPPSWPAPSMTSCFRSSTKSCFGFRLAATTACCGLRHDDAFPCGSCISRLFRFSEAALGRIFCLFLLMFFPIDISQKSGRWLFVPGLSALRTQAAAYWTGARNSVRFNCFTNIDKLLNLCTQFPAVSSGDQLFLRALRLVFTVHPVQAPGQCQPWHSLSMNLTWDRGVGIPWIS